jgi:predicted ATPase/class 3 adenylate cyclase
VSIFLFTDIEGSTQLWEEHRLAMTRALMRHDALLTEQITQHGGQIIKHTGDGVFAIFETGQPLECVLRIQQAFAQIDWSPLPPMRIRIALNAGEAERRGDDYFGPVINRAARMLPVGWGGQILLTAAVAQQGSLPEGVVLKDLGVHLLPDLHEPQPIYTLLHPDLPQQEFPPLRTLSFHPHNLPVQATPFVGRERELAELRQLWEDDNLRLLTLTGPGGMGKTRLVLQLAAEQITAYRHGVYFVPLASVGHPEGVVPAIASTLRFYFYGPQAATLQLLGYLRDKELLLILDNYEHLLDGAQLLADMLANAPQLRLLVTSRERLNLPQEASYVVHGMGLSREINGVAAAVTDGGGSGEFDDALDLFMQSARHVRPDFSLTPTERSAAIRICQLVGGMPLAIELAAAWAHLLPCHQIADQIERGFAFLTGAAEQFAPRQHSLRAVFDYLWGFLADYERRIICRLAVFRGGFSREAAAEVADASFFFLSNLVDRALLRVSAHGRYEMHEMLRQYALEQLANITGEKELVRDQHAAYYAGWLFAQEEKLYGPEQRAVQVALGEEIDNLLLAWRYLLQNWLQPVRRPRATALLHQMDYGLYLYYETRGLMTDGRDLFARAARQIREIGLESMTSAEQNLWAMMATLEASMSLQLGSLQPAAELLRQCLTIFRRNDSRQDQVLALAKLATICFHTGDYEQLDTLCREGLVLARAENLEWDEVHLLKLMGNAAYVQSRFDEAHRLYEDTQLIAKRRGYSRPLADSMNNLGIIASALGDFDESERLLKESMAAYIEAGFHHGTAVTLNNLADVAVKRGDYDRAYRLFHESLTIYQKAGVTKQIAFTLKNIGDVALAAGDLAQAEQHYQQCLTIYQEIADQREIAYSYNHLGDVAQARSDYAAAADWYQQALAIFREIDYHPGQSYALDSLGAVARLQERYEAAEKLHQEALTIYRQGQNDAGVGHALNYLGQLAQAQGQFDLAETYFADSLATFTKIGLHLGQIKSLTDLGQLRLVQQDPAAATESFCQALGIALQLHTVRLALQVLLHLALVRQQQAELLAPEEALRLRLPAVEVVTLCQEHPASDRETRQKAAAVADQLTAGLSAEQVARAQEKGWEMASTQLTAAAIVALAGCPNREG